MTNYLMQAINIYDFIPIKKVRSSLSGKVVNSSPTELQIEYGEKSYLFVFRFGALVAFNLSDEIVQAEIQRITEILGPGLKNPTNETFEVQFGSESDVVEFEQVKLRQFSLSSLRLIAITLGQSATLEYFEINAGRMLQETMDLMQRLSKEGSLPYGSKVLLKFIGSAAATRQNIISNLAILDPPEETWSSKDLQELFGELQQNFDIHIRFRTLDRKLSLVQDNIEILVNMAMARRTALLEFMIVILIVFELGLAIFKSNF